MLINRRQASTALAALMAGASRPGQAQTSTPLPVELFFQEAAMTGAALSPSGTRVALRVGSKDDRVRLSTLDLETMKVTPVAAFTDADIFQFRWINDERLVFSLTDNRAAPADRRFAQGLFAVNADGQGFRQLVKRFDSFVQDSIATKQLPWNNFLLDQVGAQTGDEVFIVQPEAYSDKGADYFKLLRLNTVSNRVVDIETPLNAFQWLIDGKGELRAVLTRKDKTAAIHLRDVTTGSWRKLREFDRFFGGNLMLHWAREDGSFLVTARVARDTDAVYTYDPATDRLSDKPLIASAQFDIAPDFIASDDKLLGWRFTVDGAVTQWLDEGMKAHQAEVDKLLPSTANMLSPPRRGNSPFVLVHAYADVQPELFYLYNKQTKKLTKLGAAMPDIKPAQMAQMDFVTYKARDGLPIPAYLTLPRGEVKKNLPLIVYVHGGPWVRGSSWGFRREVQFLASRGYAVLQPEFRGSRGFGDKHFKAGWKQWGLAMQNDLADGARWAIAEGIADPKRVAIIGASYGGYAAMMGLVNDGDLFRCAVNWVGVSDLDLLYGASWDDIGDEVKRYSMPVLLGDREKDAAQLKATSPLHNAARIKNPLLMAYGRIDKRVPIEHGKRMHDAVKPHNPKVEWVQYDKEGHGWALAENNIDFWQRVEKFLATHIPVAQ
jgi:dipeptidyl aminopeptidase/acylaminoacyl peptidase